MSQSVRLGPLDVCYWCMLTERPFALQWHLGDNDANILLLRDTIVET
jgi:hypothetical protein